MDRDKIGLLARAITTAIVAIIGVLALLGVDVPIINENTMTAVISAILYVGVLAWSHWKNNDYTLEARIKTKEMHELKALNKAAGSGNFPDVDDIAHEEYDPEDAEV